MIELEDKRKIGVLIYPEAEVLDITGPHEVFAMALGFQQQYKLPKLYEVFLISNTLEPVKMSSGMNLMPDYRFEDCPQPLDTLIIPGAEDIEYVLNYPELLNWVKHQSGKVRRLVSICTGAFFLARLGLLDKKKVTTHWGHCHSLQKTHPSLEVISNAIILRKGIPTPLQVYLRAWIWHSRWSRKISARKLP